ASPQSPGVTVHWTSSVTCTATPQYQFWIRNPAGTWTVAQAWSSANTFAWTSPSTQGSYLVQVNVRNTGANDDPNGDNNTAVSFFLSSCDTPTLSTSAASPYPSGAGAITLTANGQCGGGTQYQFYYKDPSTGWHLISGYGSSNTVQWAADFAAGGYVLEADLRPVGSTAAWITYVDTSFTLTGCGVPSLSSDLPSPQTPGVTVHWTASVSCTGTPQYQFWVRDPTGSWSIGQVWGSSNTFTWKSPAGGGSYLVQVNVRNAGANDDPNGDNNTAVSYFLSSCDTPTLTTSAGSPYVSGSGPVQLTAGGQCGGGTQYQFYYKDPNTGWHLISAYGSSNTALWNADYAAGNYLLEVDLRPVGSTASWVTYLDISFTLTGCGVPTLTSDLASPQAAGMTVHWTATVACTGTAQYQFWVRNPSGGWSIVQAWSSSNTFTWTSPATPGTYLVQVNVRNAGANEDPNGDNNTAVTYTLT
ncbi:MAG TPA: hypothetical protein VHO95_10560, partial [Candidatus Dormibacteraeota bacterium]|nr:hypothetical protein [Candidatus Dormibacteraeota bacterium]